MAVYYVGDSNPDGMSFGLSTTEKITFFNGTPVVQPATVSTVVTAAITTAAATTTTTFQGLLDAKLRASNIAINTVIARLKTLNLIASA
ncbi:MAG: hypothetical protein H7829_17105 [Magnetococcus sp. THC-1_WYH]